MKVLIFSGGTGSIALQTGFHENYSNLIDVQILTNAYDNGKSTGLVRQVFDGKILGPSDVRKNQTTQFKLKNSIGKNNKSDSTECRILDFLEHRFNCETKDAEQYCLDRLQRLNLDPQSMKTLTDAVVYFFNKPKSKQISYNDFSLSNIVYAGIAAQNNFSLSIAAKIMANILNLPSTSVILNDDKSLFLRAETESGYHILDEGEIVEWNNEHDRIKQIYFVDDENKKAEPKLSAEAIDAIKSADIIIFSSGTQWASLIPTYLTSDKSFYSLIKHVKAKKFLVINNQQDKDMIGCSVNYMLDVLENFLPLDNIIKVFNSNADDAMKISNLGDWDKTLNYEFCLSPLSSKTHNTIVSKIIMQIFYEKYLSNNKFVFDYDDTLVGRNNEYRSESVFNMASAASLNLGECESCIFTGNYIKALDLNYANDIENNFYSNIFHSRFLLSSVFNYEKPSWDKSFKIYADGGVNLYEITHRADKDEFKSEIKFVKCIDKNAVFTNEQVEQILQKISEAGIKQTKVQNRNNATLSIKPVDDEYRIPVCKLLNIMMNNEFYIRPSGRTTIDISQFLNTKDLAFNHFKKSLRENERVTYVGDESHYGGNDHILTKNDMIDYLHVNNPKETTIFLITLLNFRGSAYV